MNEMVTITKAEYDRLREAAEDLADIQAYDRAMAERGEGIPAEYVNRMIAGESPLRVWREFRGLSQSELARRSKVNRVYIGNIEAGDKPGSAAALKALAGALGIAIDDLV